MKSHSGHPCFFSLRRVVPTSSDAGIAKFHDSIDVHVVARWDRGLRMRYAEERGEVCSRELQRPFA